MSSRTINLSYDDIEFDRLERIKKKSKSQSWEKFFFQLATDKDFWEKAFEVNKTRKS
jgi:hypothetical protein